MYEQEICTADIYCIIINKFDTNLEVTNCCKVQTLQGSTATDFRWGGKSYFSFICSSSL